MHWCAANVAFDCSAHILASPFVDLNEKARGIKAKERLIEILNNSGNEFIIVSQGVDKYGRCLGEIFINDKSVNKILLDEGLAVPYGGGKKK